MLAWLAQALAAGPWRIGELSVRPGIEVRHCADAAQPAEGLTRYENPQDAAEIARYTDAGEYRPLKTAPNLRRGWRLHVADPAALRLALDLFYPGRLGAWVAWRAGRLQITDLRETLGRQSGMYRVTQKLTNVQADALVGRFCRTDGGCLRTILWKRDAAGTQPSSELPSTKYDPRVAQAGGTDGIPLLCQEACNLLVAEARRVVKESRA